MRCDVRRREERAALVLEATDCFGRIDVLVNNAGVGYLGAVVDMTAEDVERVVATNLTALIDLTRLVLPGMLQRHDGDVLMVSSAAAWVSLPPLTVYAASKRAVDGFVEGLRREVGPQGIRIHSVNPGPVATEFHARALRLRPREGEPGLRPGVGVGPERVARRAVRELRSGRGRTVAVPRALGPARLLGVPPVAHVADFGIRSVAGRLARLGRTTAVERAPTARRDRP
ncbi:SDR family NAD(P)-dependent oxidoreductase [Pseudonocardia nigra]|uniref:SDR family NAD(P)-dependent oxidoreductase n=1 Tax=Pseudonocardia nigra TaxID=1921578 RepID=UPI0027E321FC|nr:SDR family oxidoreductase [Pseudonocardia nigra]